MLATYGFGLFPLPRYREVKGEGWLLRHHLPSMSEGYLTEAFVEGNRFVLYQGKVPWMSTGLFEVESHAWHVHCAQGVVAVAGLGMGMYAYAVSKKPEVTRVVVVERDPQVLEILRRSAGFDDWPGRDKIEIVIADAFAPDWAAAFKGARPDYLYADIWPITPDATAPEQCAAMVRALNPVHAGWWGQEFNAGQWALAQGREIDEAALADYFGNLGVPVSLTPGYTGFCRDVAAINKALLSPKPAKKPGLLAKLLGFGV